MAAAMLRVAQPAAVGNRMRFLDPGQIIIELFEHSQIAGGDEEGPRACYSGSLPESLLPLLTLIWTETPSHL